MFTRHPQRLVSCFIVAGTSWLSSPVIAAPILPVSWVTETVNNASASTAGNDALELRVFRTAYAMARADLGVLPGPGTLSISYDWTIRAEGWYEYSVLTLDTNYSNTPAYPLGGCTTHGLNCSGDGRLPVTGLGVGCGTALSCSSQGLIAAYTVDFRLEPPSAPGEQMVAPAYGTRSGQIALMQGAAGQSFLNFLMHPSGYSENGDHFNTYLSVSNIQLSFVAEATPVPLPPALLTLLPALGALASFRRRVQAQD